MNNMQKVILSLFCPILVAIAVRIVLFIVAFILSLGGYLLNAGEEFGRFVLGLGGFNTFVWNESWGFWALVAILTFFAEMFIWQED